MSVGPGVARSSLTSCWRWCCGACWVAGARLDRLHHRVDGARGALDAQLVRRAVAAELRRPALDPASAARRRAAGRCCRRRGARAPTPLRAAGRAPSAGRRTARPAESELSAALQAALRRPGASRAAAGPAGDGCSTRLAAAWYRVQLARRFHNEAVAAAPRARAASALVPAGSGSPGTRRCPQAFELDDDRPERPARRSGLTARLGRDRPSSGRRCRGPVYD